MPIKVPNNLPARQTLEREGVMVLSEEDAIRQDIRPLRIGMLNLMPDKIRTETQFARPVRRDTAAGRVYPAQNDWAHPEEHAGRPYDRLLSRYQRSARREVRRHDRHRRAGRAPRIRGVSYWPELVRFLDWTVSHVHSTFCICWGAQAAIFSHHGVGKHRLSHKAFGVFRHKNLNPASPYLRGFSDDFSIPVSRWTEVRRADLPTDAGLEVLMEFTRPGCASSPTSRIAPSICSTTSNTTRRRWPRSTARHQQRQADQAPTNYFPHDDPHAHPENRWRSHAHLLFGNWINQVYQTTPFDCSAIGTRGTQR